MDLAKQIVLPSMQREKRDLHRRLLQFSNHYGFCSQDSAVDASLSKMPMPVHMQTGGRSYSVAIWAASLLKKKPAGGNAPARILFLLFPPLLDLPLITGLQQFAGVFQSDRPPVQGHVNVPLLRLLKRPHVLQSLIPHHTAYFEPQRPNALVCLRRLTCSASAVRRPLLTASRHGTARHWSCGSLKPQS